MKYQYSWPTAPISSTTLWQKVEGQPFLKRSMPETSDDLYRDSRWPAIFPAPMCLVTTTDGKQECLEKVVSPVVVNRFPYVLTLSFCKDDLSGRHYARRRFMNMLEEGRVAAVQFIFPGEELDKVMQTIESVPDERSHDRLRTTALPLRKAVTNTCSIFKDAYLTYEVRLVKPSKDMYGDSIYEKPYHDQGSHRIYFLEINAIQLRDDIAKGEEQLLWHSLPHWDAPFLDQREIPQAENSQDLKYRKPYNPQYTFPSRNTVAFQADEIIEGMAIKRLAPSIIFSNQDSRWPCFFPSSLGMITTYSDEGVSNCMPCGSTGVVSRSPFTFAIAVGYAEINERYTKRQSLDFLLKRPYFGCGVAFDHPFLINAITSAGNTSFAQTTKKLENTGLFVDSSLKAPVLKDLPVNFQCRIVNKIKLGTHLLILGEVESIIVRDDVTVKNPIQWYPWAKPVVQEAVG